jgi:hypothetical protein
MTTVERFQDRLKKLDRPRFSATRYGHVGREPFQSNLADVGDDGSLRVYLEIQAHEVPAFIEWCSSVWVGK